MSCTETIIPGKDPTRIESVLRRAHVPEQAGEDLLLERIADKLRRRPGPRRALRFDLAALIGLVAAAALSATLCVLARQAHSELAIGLATAVMASCTLWILGRSVIAGSFRLIHRDCRAAAIIAIGSGATLNLLIR